MKTFHIVLRAALFLFIAAACSNGAAAQSSKQEKEAGEAAAVKSMMDAQRYVFEAQSVLPMSGRTKYLTSEYTVKVTKDLVDAYLPYFGRAYTAPLDPTKGGIQFRSKSFDYSVAPGKKGGWNVLVKPKDVSDVQQLSFSISSNGYASLQVISNNRQPISFNGYITEVKEKKDK